MRVTDWSAVVASAPVNKDAAKSLVYGADGEEPILLERAIARIPALAEGTPNFQNLIGVRKGWLTVVAYAGSSRPNQRALGTKGAGGARWIVRCVCGRYELRRTRALGPKSNSDRCGPCDKLRWMQERAKEKSPLR